MNLGGTATVWTLSIVLIAWLFDLVRRDRLYVGYGVIFVSAIIAGVVTIAVPSVLLAVGRWWAGVLPASGFLELVMLFVVVLLIYVFSQLTLFSSRVTQLIQELAIRDAAASRSGPPSPPR